MGKVLEEGKPISDYGVADGQVKTGSYVFLCRFYSCKQLA
jgi:hypothetical protein